LKKAEKILSGNLRGRMGPGNDDGIGQLKEIRKRGRERYALSD